MGNIEFDMNNLSEEEISDLNKLAMSAANVNNMAISYESNNKYYIENLNKLIDAFDQFRKNIFAAQTRKELDSLLDELSAYILILETIIRNSERPALGFNDLMLKQKQTVSFPNLLNEYVFEINKLIVAARELYNIKNPVNIHKTDVKKQWEINTVLLNKIYEISNGKIFLCTEPDFIQWVSQADFSKLDFKIKSKGKKLIHFLSKSMGEEWYLEAVKSKNITKDDCNKVTNTGDFWFTEMVKLTK